MPIFLFKKFINIESYYLLNIRLILYLINDKIIDETLLLKNILKMRETMNFIYDFFSGAVIGIANIIPGVSGGTMALVLGIYEKLITSIGNISMGTVKSVLKAMTLKKSSIDEFKNEMDKINALFLIVILSGAVIAIVSLAKAMSFFLDKFHDPTYGFFFGLVLLSVLSPYKLIKNKNIRSYVIILISVSIVVLISNYITDSDKLIEKAIVKGGGHSKVFGSLNISYIILLGAVAISAMILPGVSGSFLLLLLGGYFPLLKALSNWDFLFLLPFIAGCVIGLFLFTKILNFLLKKFHDGTMSFLVGLVFGSLWMIWPFKRIEMVNNEAVYLNNIFPHSINMNEIFTFFTFITGLIIVYLLFLIENKRNR